MKCRTLIDQVSICVNMIREMSAMGNGVRDFSAFRELCDAEMNVTVIVMLTFSGNNL